MKKLLLFGLLGAVLSYLFYSRLPHLSTSLAPPSKPEEDSDRVLIGLRKQAQPRPACTRIAVGYNANLDLIVKAKDLLEAMNIQPAGSMDHPSIGTLSELQEVFSYYMRSGSAAERTVDGEDVFTHIVESATSLPNKTFSTGGNAALMANRLATEGCEVLLGGAVGSTLSQLLHPAVKIIKNEANTEVKDEVHLILEYPTGMEWGGYSSPRANRLIVTRDTTNAILSPLEAFHKSLPEFDPSLVVVSGFHLLEAQPSSFRKQRIEKVLISVNSVPETTRGDKKFVAVHMELASIGSSEYLKELTESTVPHVDSLGLNEQELGGIYTVTGGKEYSVEDFKQPQVLTVVDAIKHVFEFSRNQSKVNSYGRTLSRVHFHCLHFHLIVQQRISMWHKGITSVASGSLACSQQACDFENVDLLLPLSFEVAKGRTVELDLDSPAAAWREGDFEYYLAPVLVCKKVYRTVGLGDSISAVGLVYHDRKTKKN